uniref:Pentacotripeptide-repeat region of PRORP domain-containing protein n=1 Tax=Picea sitchensis TaxID=3332 RepID=B8LKN6_PICSI|nr:unknown [Picea sitchensis]
MGLRVFALHCHPRSSLLLHLCTKAKTLAEAKQVHAHMLLTGILRIPSVETKLLNLYVKCGSLPDARLAFDNMTKGDVFPWNVMIGGYVKHGETREALELYHQMQKVSSTNPDNYTYSSVLNACARLASLSEGKLIYDEIISKGCEMDVIVENALINMFMKCGSIEDARRVFDKMCERNLVSWTAMVSGYAQGGFADEALRMFYEMQGEDVKANYVTVASVLPACAQLSDLQQGKEIHGYIIRRGLDLGIVVGNALIDMYAKCGSIGSAQKVFDKMLQRDVVSWNVAIAGYAQNGRFDECMELFRKMQCAGLKIDVITWNTLITAYAQNGYGDQTLELFQQMQLRGVKPNSITIASVLSACAAVSALQEGKRIHDLVNRSECKSDICVGNALIDM